MPDTTPKDFPDPASRDYIVAMADAAEAFVKAAEAALENARQSAHFCKGLATATLETQRKLIEAIQRTTKDP